MSAIKKDTLLFIWGSNPMKRELHAIKKPMISAGPEAVCHPKI